MLRIQKRYNFGFHETENDKSNLVNGKIIEFTSYPGSVYSQDDFYKITTDGESRTVMTVVGTEIQNNNRQLWEKIMKSNQVPIRRYLRHIRDSRYEIVFVLFFLSRQVLVGARTMAANRLSSNSRQWYEVFSNYNSGTGNKQWLIINANQSIEFGVVEQMPGIVSYDELSKTLLSTTYWVSSGYPSLEVSRLNVLSKQLTSFFLSLSPTRTHTHTHTSR